MGGLGEFIDAAIHDAIAQKHRGHRTALYLQRGKASAFR